MYRNDSVIGGRHAIPSSHMIIDIHNAWSEHRHGEQNRPSDCIGSENLYGNCTMAIHIMSYTNPESKTTSDILHTRYRNRG